MPKAATTIDLSSFVMMQILLDDGRVTVASARLRIEYLRENATIAAMEIAEKNVRPAQRILAGARKERTTTATMSAVTRCV
jgi:hypothetical protein